MIHFKIVFITIRRGVLNQSQYLSDRLFMTLILPLLISGSLLLLAFITVTNPRKANVVANRWLSSIFLYGLCHRRYCDHG
jgi:hypothetical protein